MQKCVSSAQKVRKHVSRASEVLRVFKRNFALHHWKILIEFHSCSQFYVASLITRETTCHVRHREECMARALVTCIIRPSSSCYIVVPIFESPAQDISIPDVPRNEGTHSMHVHSACITLLSSLIRMTLKRHCRPLSVSQDS